MLYRRFNVNRNTAGTSIKYCHRSFYFGVIVCIITAMSLFSTTGNNSNSPRKDSAREQSLLCSGAITMTKPDGKPVNEEEAKTISGQYQQLEETIQRCQSRLVKLNDQILELRLALEGVKGHPHDAPICLREYSGVLIQRTCAEVLVEVSKELEEAKEEQRLLKEEKRHAKEERNTLTRTYNIRPLSVDEVINAKASQQANMYAVIANDVL
eukprot:jgi/Bigna1/131390/aug1.14_g6098